MNRKMALPYVSFCIDDAGSQQLREDMPANARLVGWQCGFEPLFVAVWSSFTTSAGNLHLDDSEAEELAAEFLSDRGWFGGEEPTPADYII